MIAAHFRGVVVFVAHKEDTVFMPAAMREARGAIEAEQAVLVTLVLARVLLPWPTHPGDCEKHQ